MLRFLIWTIAVCSESANAFALGTGALRVPSHSLVPPQIPSKNWARVLIQAKKRTRLTATDQSAEERAAVLQASLGAAEKEIERLRRSAGQPGGQYQGTLQIEQLLEFERKGHTKTEALLGSKAEADAIHAAVMSEYLLRRKEAYVQKIRLFAVEDGDDDLYQQALLCRSEAEARSLLEGWSKDNQVDVPFLQVFNVHRGSTPEAKAINLLASSPRMGQLAAALLGVASVRLYQTSVFMKERGHGETSWHCDLATSPFDTNGMVTCWIALTAIETEADSPLEFATGSHRDVALPYWYSEAGMERPSGDEREYDIDTHLPFLPGDATWHHGWLLHAAPPNDGPRHRLALSITYVSADAHVLDVADEEGLRRLPEDEDRESYADWFDELEGGGVASHELLPVVFPPKRAGLGLDAKKKAKK